MEGQIFIYIPVKTTLAELSGLLKDAYEYLKDIGAEVPGDVELKTDEGKIFLAAPGSGEPVVVRRGEASVELSCIRNDAEGYICLPVTGVDRDVYEILDELADEYGGYVDGDPEALKKYEESVPAPMVEEEVWVSEKLVDLCHKVSGVPVIPNTCIGASLGLREALQALVAAGVEESAVVTGYDEGLETYYSVGVVRGAGDEKTVIACIMLPGDEKLYEAAKKTIYMLTLADPADTENPDRPLRIDYENNVVTICTDSDKVVDEDDIPLLLAKVKEHIYGE